MLADEFGGLCSADIAAWVKVNRYRASALVTQVYIFHAAAAKFVEKYTLLLAIEQWTVIADVASSVHPIICSKKTVFLRLTQRRGYVFASTIQRLEIFEEYFTSQVKNFLSQIRAKKIWPAFKYLSQNNDANAIGMFLGKESD